MPSITVWHRLEPSTADELAPVLEARVHDPLWMLGRQWQLGEHNGEDAGSPVAVRVRATQAPLTRFAPGAAPAAAVALDPRGAPLDALIGTGAPPARDLRAAADAGIAFVRLLVRQHAAAAAPLFAARFPLAPAATALVDDAGRRFLALAGGRIPDGGALAAALRPGLAANPPRLPAEPALPAALIAPALTAARAWLTWFERAHPPPAPPTWVDERLEHRFAIAAHDGRDEHVLRADEHGGGALDWYSFERGGPSLQTPPAPTELVSTTLPTQVAYRGMPAARWWELEDARVSFGAVAVGSEDVARLLFLEFALIYATDWFLTPLTLDAGGVCRIRSVVVTDGFGVQTLIEPAAQLDAGWSMFDAARSAATPGPPLFVLPPTAAAPADGAPVEEVLFLRDEMANLAWAVERAVVGPHGQPIDRVAQWARGRQAAAPSDRADGVLAYRLGGDAPEHWIPFVPVRVDDHAIRLRRGAMLRVRPDGVQETVKPHSQLLATGRPMLVHEEEVPRAGARVVERYRLARAVDGTRWLWRARVKEPGRGEGYAGLVYDRLDP